MNTPSKTPSPSSRRRSQPSLTLFLNAREIQTNAATLEELVTEHGHADAKIATAVNGEFVPARARSTTLLRSGDRVELVTARQGG